MLPGLTLAPFIVHIGDGSAPSHPPCRSPAALSGLFVFLFYFRGEVSTPEMKVPPFEIPVEEMKEELDRLRRPLRIAVLRSKNPFNIGAIIRVAHSFLVEEIVLVGDAPYYRRAAMGMERYENLVNLPDEAALIERARSGGNPLVVLERDHASEGIWSADLPENPYLVFGNEDDGVGQELIEAADQILAIPMYGINHSYPVAVAAGIAMAEWTRRFVAADLKGRPSDDAPRKLLEP